MDVGTMPSLEPLTMGQILDRAFRLYRRRFLTFVGIIAVALVPLMLIQLVFTVLSIPNILAAAERYNEAAMYSGEEDVFGEWLNLLSTSTGGGRTVVFSALQFVLVQGIATAALARAVGDNYLGRATDIPGAYGRIGPIWLRLLGMIGLAVLAFAGLFIFLMLPCVGWLGGLGLFIYFTAVIYPMLPPVLALEGQSAAGVFRRAWDLARRRFWWSLGFMLILGIFSLVVVGAPTYLLSLGLLLGLQGMAASDPVMATTIQTVIQSVTTLLLTLLYQPLRMTAITLMYFDLRVRTEGFDLALLAATAGGEPGVEGAEVAAQAPRPERGNVVTGNEILYFFGISASILTVCALCYGVTFALTMLLITAAAPYGY